MPANRNALIRYKTIDNCLRNPYRRWTLEDLVDACSDALYEYEGIDKGISNRGDFVAADFGDVQQAAHLDLLVGDHDPAGDR